MIIIIQMQRKKNEKESRKETRTPITSFGAGFIGPIVGCDGLVDARAI